MIVSSRMVSLADLLRLPGQEEAVDDSDVGLQGDHLWWGEGARGGG